MILKEKKTTSSDKLIVVQSVSRTRSRRMKFCVHGGLGALPSTSFFAMWLSTCIACAMCVQKSVSYIQIGSVS